MDHLVDVLRVRQPFQRAADARQRRPDRPHDAVVALLQLRPGLAQLFRCRLDRRHDPVEESRDVLLQLRQVRVVPGLHEPDQVLQDRLRVPRQVQPQLRQVLRHEAVDEGVPRGLDQVHLLRQRGHVLDLLLGHADPAVFHVELAQVLADRRPVVQQVQHLRGPLFAEHLARCGQLLLIVHPGHGVHHGHGVLPFVRVVFAAHARGRRDLLLVAHVDPGHRVVQVLEAVVGAFHRVRPFLDRRRVRVPEARQVHPAVRPPGQLHHLFPHFGDRRPHRADHPGEDALDRAADAVPGFRDLPEAVRQAFRRHRGHRRVVPGLLHPLAQAVQVVLHPGQRGPRVVQLLLPALHHVGVVAVFLLRLVQGRPQGLDHLFLLGDLLPQALRPGLGLLLLRGVFAQLRGLRLQFGLQRPQVPLRLFYGPVVFVLAVQPDPLLDLFRRHVLTSLSSDRSADAFVHMFPKGFQGAIGKPPGYPIIPRMPLPQFTRMS